MEYNLPKVEATSRILNILISISSNTCTFASFSMNTDTRQRIIDICEQKIAKNGKQVGVSFYVFFANKNTNPKELMTVAKWWIEKHQLDHFEKAIKIKEMVLNEVQ